MPIADAAGACPDNWPYLVTAYLLGVVVPTPGVLRRPPPGDGKGEK